MRRVLCVMAAVMGLLAAGSLAAAQQEQVHLSLLAAFAPGSTIAAEQAPQLMAFLASGKRIDCLQRNAAVIAVTDSVTTAAAPPPGAACSALLRPGVYTLQAAAVEGSDWPSWQCYSAAGGATQEVPLLPGSSQAVELTTGSYTCVATYSPQSPTQAAAAAAIDWDAEVARAVAPPVAAGGSTGGVTVSAAAAAACLPPMYTQPPRGKPPRPLRLSNAQVIDAVTYRDVKIHAINWFGFNVPMGMVDGLWAGGTEAATDFALIAYQLALLGYNTVRLPFTHKNLANENVWWLRSPCTPVSADALEQRLIDPAVWTPRMAAGRVLPANPSPMANDPAGTCNTYLPQRMNKDRFLFVIQAFIAQGMYVVLDYHPQGTEDEPFDLSRFVSAWSSLWRDITCLPNFESDMANRIIVDVMNEPDSMGIRWEAQGGRPGAEQLYLATADALWAATPDKVLFAFEGTGQNMYGLNWGNGFITDESIINSRGLSNPNSFFRQLVTKPYAKATIITPHVYPPSITLSTWLGPALWQQCEVSFNYLQSLGYNNTRFPVVAMETGSAFATAEDRAWLKDFADYVRARGAARAYNRVSLDGWGWWAFNENSGDTGGIVMNGWQDLNWEKLRYMIDLGLMPWYRTTAGMVGRK